MYYEYIKNEFSASLITNSLRSAGIFISNEHYQANHVDPAVMTTSSFFDLLDIFP
jgi:hypothetical protein